MLSLLFYSAYADLVLIIEQLPVCISVAYRAAHSFWKLCIRVSCCGVTTNQTSAVKIRYFSRRCLFKKLLSGFAVWFVCGDLQAPKGLMCSWKSQAEWKSATIWKALYKWMESSVTYFCGWLRGGLVLGPGERQDFICDSGHKSMGWQVHWKAGAAALQADYFFHCCF